MQDPVTLRLPAAGSSARHAAGSGDTVADEVNYPKPGDAPQQFRFNATGARYVRVNATVLSVDQNGYHYFELRQIGVQGT